MLFEFHMIQYNVRYTIAVFCCSMCFTNADLTLKFAGYPGKSGTHVLPDTRNLPVLQILQKTV